MAGHIAALVDEILDAEGVAHSVDHATDGAELLELVNAPGYECNLILLDIMMERLGGMEAARQLRELGHPATIIFITISESFAVEGYDVQAAGYLLKPVDKGKLKKALLHDYTVNFLHRFLILPQRSQTWRLPIREITYIEIAGRRLAVHLPDKTVHHTARLDDLAAQLPGALFVRCHKSYLANLQNVRLIRRYRLTMVTGEEVPISKAYYDEVKRRFLAHLKN